MKPIYAVCLTLVLCGLIVTAVQAQQAAGYIEKLEGPLDAFELYRERQKIEVAPLMELYINDELIINREKCKEEDACQFILRFGDEEMPVGISYSVIENREPQSLPRELLKKFEEWFRIAHQEHRIILTIKDPVDIPLAMPLLTNAEARLIEGTRSLSLGWYGGEKPYQLRLSRGQNGQVLVEAGDIEEGYFRYEGMMLAEGIYQVEIQDAQGTSVKSQFQVIPRDMLPAPPAELEQSALDESGKQTLFALWLIEEHDGWNFEAYQLVAPLAGDYYPALLVREQLELY